MSFASVIGPCSLGCRGKASPSRRSVFCIQGPSTRRAPRTGPASILGLGAIPRQVPGIDDTDATMCQARPVPDDEDNAGRQQSQGANDEPAEASTMKSV